MIAADIGDFRALARRRLPHFLFEYVDGGSFAETTLARNRADLQAIALRQRVMRDVSAIDLATTICGRRLSMPVALAPIGIAGMYARRGEVQAAQAAEAEGVPFTLSTMSCCPLEEVRRAVEEPFWMQLYMIRDRGFMDALLARAWDSGIETLMLTVDLPVHSARYREPRSGMSGPQTAAVRLRRWKEMLLHPRWAWDVGLRGRPHILGNVAPAMPGGAGLAQFIAWVGRNFDPSIGWKDIDWIRARWPGRLLVKGILDPADAADAVSAGAAAVVVSNHGGRQLDGALSSIAALPAVADRVGGQAAVMMDGGIGSGLDVVRALACGADAVLIGRAWAFALAARGGRGVREALGILRREIEVAMALTGSTDVKKIDRSILA